MPQSSRRQQLLSQKSTGWIEESSQPVESPPTIRGAVSAPTKPIRIKLMRKGAVQGQQLGGAHHDTADEKEEEEETTNGRRTTSA